MSLALKLAIIRVGETQGRIAARADVDRWRFNRAINARESLTVAERDRLLVVLRAIGIDEPVEVLFPEPLRERRRPLDAIPDARTA